MTNCVSLWSYTHISSDIRTPLSLRLLLPRKRAESESECESDRVLEDHRRYHLAGLWTRERVIRHYEPIALGTEETGYALHHTAVYVRALDMLYHQIKTSTNFSTDVQRILQDSSTREQLPRKDVDAVDGDANHH